MAATSPRSDKFFPPPGLQLRAKPRYEARSLKQHGLSRMSVPNFTDRKEAADKARQAMLEKFRTKAQATKEPDPTTVAMREELARERETKRAAAEEKRKARIAAEKAQRIAEAKAKAEAEAVRIRDEMIASAQRRRAEREAAEIKAFEDQAKRDLANASLKARRK